MSATKRARTFLELYLNPTHDGAPVNKIPQPVLAFSNDGVPLTVADFQSILDELDDVHNEIAERKHRVSQK